MSESSSPADSEAKKPSKAGRNLPAAIAVGLSLIAMIVASLFIVKTVFAFVVMAALTVATFEITSAMRTAKIQVPAIPVYRCDGNNDHRYLVVPSARRC